MLLLDLDDTIFQTNSMNPKIFDSAISVIRKYYSSKKTEENIEKIELELWSNPIDVVFSKYQTPKIIRTEFYKRIRNINYATLNISTFKDYEVIKSLAVTKILVTTGLKELQLGKIKALGIESDFESIHIDDPQIKPRQYKIDIFKQILNDSKIAPEEIWVIGDNPDSEIKAGKKLGMRTIQRKSNSKKSSKFSDYEIESFEELKGILKLN